MLSHLKILRERVNRRVNFDENNIADAIQIVKGRANYAEQRLHLGEKGRLSGVKPLIRLLLDRKYHQYGRGIRSFVKDILA